MASPLERLMVEPNGVAQHSVFAGLVLDTPAATPVASTAEAKSHLRVDTSADDTLIDSLVDAATKRVEREINQSLITQTWKLTLDDFPSRDYVMLPKGPLQSVTSITTYDEDDSATVFSSASYLVDTAGDRVALNIGDSWPSDLRPRAAVLIEYVAGFGDAATDVPQDLIQAVLATVAHWYENRGDEKMIGLPPLAEAILSHWREFRL